jgi:hypothetical protein
MIKNLHIFDFDGTLFLSPTPDTGQAKYEKLTGIPWLVNKEASRELTRKHKRFVPIRRGWWGRPETLEPPLVADPAPLEWFVKPVCDAYHQSKTDPESLTLIMTGRHVGLKNQVLRIIDDGGLAKIERRMSKNDELYCKCVDPDVTVHCLGEEGPKPKGQKPTETFPWKVWIMEQYMAIYPEIQKIEIWEDREKHVTEFRELNGMLAPEVVVNFITAGQ